MQGDQEPPPVVYIGSQDLARISSLLPSNRKRSMIVHSLVSSLGLMTNTAISCKRRLQVISPRQATYKELAAYHTRDYLEVVLSKTSDKQSPGSEPGLNAELGLEDDCPMFAGLADYVQLVGGATLTATKVLQQNLTDIAICWDGGRHHARKSQASGFCYVADCILAILALKRLPVQLSDMPIPAAVPQKPRIMYLDLDLHFSDAVSEAFYSITSPATPQVLTFSIHHSSPGFFPVSERAALPDVSSPGFDPFTLSLPLKQGASDATYARIWPIVEQVRNTFNPDFVVLQCGVDGLAGDPCTTFNWSLGDSTGSMGWCIQNVLNEWPGKKLLLGGGDSPRCPFPGFAFLCALKYFKEDTIRRMLPEHGHILPLSRPLSLDTEIPDHGGFPLYGPSFTLDVSAGNMFDHNSEEYLRSLEVAFEKINKELYNRLTLRHGQVAASSNVIQV